MGYFEVIIDSFVPQIEVPREMNLFRYEKEKSVPKNLAKEMRNQGYVPNLPIMLGFNCYFNILMIIFFFPNN